MHVLVQVSAEFMYELEIYAVFHLYQVPFQVQERERGERERGSSSQPLRASNYAGTRGLASVSFWALPFLVAR